MEWIAEHIWGLVISAALAFIIGFLIGRWLGLVKGRDRVIDRVKRLMVQGKLEFDIEQILRREIGLWKLHR